MEDKQESKEVIVLIIREIDLNLDELEEGDIFFLERNGVKSLMRVSLAERSCGEECCGWELCLEDLRVHQIDVLPAGVYLKLAPYWRRYHD